MIAEIPARPATTALLSASTYTAASANAQSVSPIFTGDGQTLVFHSAASDLVENDFNQAADIFVVRLASTNPVTGFPGQIIYAPNLGQPPTITWTAVPGKTYHVVYKDNLTDLGWKPLEGGVTINDNQGSATDPAPSSSHRFYRIVAHPSL